MKDITMSVKKLLKPGTSFSVFYDNGNPNNCKMHIRAIVDRVYVVYCVWSKRKQRYRYFIESFFYFQFLIEHNRIKNIKKKGRR